MPDDAQPTPDRLTWKDLVAGENLRQKNTQDAQSRLAERREKKDEAP